MKKLTVKQKQKMSDMAYNNQCNEIFKLHKYLVECPLSSHKVGKGNPIDDAISLINYLIGNQK